jgi:hypothetical protein
MVKALLDQGVDVNAVDAADARRATPLIAAVEPGHFTVVKLLLSNGADTRALDANGKTALDIARAKDHEALVVLLSMRNADELEAPDPVVRPRDPSTLDPGALMAKLEELGAQPAKSTAPALTPEPEVEPPSQHPPQPLAQTGSKSGAEQAEVSSDQKRQLCAQVESAMAQLRNADDAQLAELGLTRTAALEQLQATLGDTCQ